MGSFLKKASFGLGLPFILLSLMAAQAPTTTTLSISPANYVASGTIVTLTATVTNPSNVTTGTVNFCNASSTDCSLGSGLYGTAQLTSAGTATILKVFSYGVNNIYAVFLPTSANAGSSSLANFVTVGGSPSYTSTTTLTASGSPGNYTLNGTVTAFGGQPLGGEAVNFLDTTSGNAQIATTSLAPAVTTFTAPILYAAGPWPYQMATGDFNGDGKSDIAIAEQNGQNAVDVMIGNGDGTFRAPVSYSAGRGTYYVAVGDFNGDGIQDLAVPNRTDGTISIFLGRGDGTFQTQVAYSAGVTPTNLAVGDFNHDGNLDIVVMNDSSTTFSILLGNGNGSFRAPVAHASGATSSKPLGDASSFAVGDFNHDGNLDLVVANSTDNTVSVILGNGDGTFQPLVRYSAGTYPMEVVVADFNGDGNLDLAVANSSDSTISILLGNGNGTFRPQVTYPAGAGPYSLAGGDFNDDGKVDLVTGSVMLLGNGDGTFKASTAASVGFVVTVGDFNGDGQLDIASVGAVALGKQVASYSQGGISVPGTGTHYVQASYPGDASHLPSQSATVPLTATGLLAQAITFTPIASPVTYGVPPISLSATGGGSGNPVTFSVLSGPGYVSGNSLVVTGVGTIVVAANQAGNSDYSDAPQVTQSVVVNVIDPTFSVSCVPNPVIYGANTTCTAALSGSATGTVSFYDNGVLWSTVPLSGSTAAVTGFAGHTPATYSVTVLYGGDADNNIASSGTTVTVIQAPQSITFTSPASPVTYGVAPIALSATASSGLGVGFSVLSGPGTVSGNILTITGAGTVVVAANQPGNIDYSASPQVTQVVIVNKATPTLTWPNPASITYGTPLSGIQLDATSGGVAGTFAYAPPSDTVLPAGTHTLSVTFTPTDSTDYNNQTSTVSLTVNPATAVVSVSCAPNPITYGSETTNCTTTVGGSATGTVTWTINGGAWTSTGLSGGAASAGGFNGYSAGSYTIGATYSGDGNYAAGVASTTLMITKANPPLNWIAPANVTFGTALSGAQLNPTSGGVAGSFVFTPAAGTVLPVGSHTLSATFTPADSTDYNVLTVITTLVVVPAVPGVNVNCVPNPITYGPQTSTCTAVVSAGATGSVAFFYNGTNWADVPVLGGAASASGFSNMPVGSYSIVANYSGDINFTPASAFTTLVIGQAAPAVTLSCSPTSISLGSNTTCTATVPATDGTVAFSSTADLAGKWWNGPFPAGGGDLGTTPIATTQDASLDYNISGEAWPSAVAGPAGVDTTNIYARWTGTFVSPTDGTYTIGVNSDDGANVYVNGTLIVGNLATGQAATSDLAYTQSAPVVLTMGSTNSIVVEYQQGSGQGGIQLLWTPPGASSASLLGWTVVPVNGSGQASITGGSAWNAGTYNVAGIYSGDANYAAATSNVVAVTVNRATPTVTVTCSPSTIVFGSTASCTAHVSAGTGTVSFTGGASQPGPWSEPVDGSGNAVLTGFTNWAAGTYTIGATYSGESNYSTASGSGVLTITTSTPVLTWATPAPIIYGTALSAAQLNATSDGVAGTFVYTPAAGAVLAAGSQVLSVTFTPTDTVDYATQTATVTLVVNKAPLTVTPDPAARLYGAANPTFTGSITGVIAGDAITATYSSSAVATTPVGVYSTGPIGITDGLSDPNSKLVNYTLTQNISTFTITQVTPSLTWATPAAITYGTALSATQLDASSGGVAGTFVYTPAAGAILAAGSQTLSVTFTPTDLADYTVQSATVTLLVNKASLTVTPNPASRLFGAANPAFSGSITGLVAGDNITATYASGATATTAVGAYSSGVNAIAATISDPGTRLGNYTLTQNLGTLTITQASTVLSWATPAAITYGTPLSAIQLDATSGGVAGAFVYTPAAGTILTAGAQTLSVTFTPTDTADYGAATLTVSLTVNKAPLTVTPNNASRLYGVVNPAFTGSITGLVAGDTVTATYASAANLTTVVGVYSSGANAIVATMVDPGSKLGNYTLTQNLGTLTITQTTTGLTWLTPAAITYGTALSSTQLDATSGGIAGTFVYTPTSGTVLAAGSQTLSVVFTPTDGADYSVATAPVSLIVNKAPLTVTPTAASKVFGTANPAFTGSITGLVAGDNITATYASAATTSTPIGTYSLGANAIASTLSDPGSKLVNYTLTQNLGTLTITQATTTLTWPTPAAITYGTPLSATQLNASSGGVPGTFGYTPAAGTVLAAGPQTLSVTFTPTDTADYSVATLTVPLTVNKAPLTVTPNSVSRLYGVANPAFTSSITGLVAGDTITATYASAANLTTVAGVYSSGVNAIAATLSDPGTKLPNYTLTQNLGALTITQATTTLTWANPAAITYGTALSAVQLNATSGGVAGTFVYTPPVGTILPVGVQSLSVTFTPTDSADYSSATATVSLTVNKAPLTITPTPASKVYGTANPTFTGSITGLVAGDTITATYASAATTSTAVGVYSSGVNAISATLADPGSKLGNYTLTQNVGALTITQAITVLTWATPAAVTYGTPLSAVQLNATSGGVAGTFVYTPAAGVVLAAGSHTLSVMFTPTDTADYGSQIATVNLQVNKAALVVTPNAALRLFGASNPAFTGSITGMIAGDGISATYASGANAATPVGVYSAGVNAIASTMIDPASKLANYTVTQNLGVLTVTQATTVLTWPAPAAITYGTALSGVQLDATSGGVAGTFVYSPVAGTVLSSGSHTLNVTFTPTDGADYSTATASVTLTVNPAVLTVTPAPSSKVYGTANPVFSGSITGMIPGDGITATYSSSANTTTTVGVYSSGPNAIAATLSDPGGKLGNYTLNQTAGTFTITQATTVLTWATPASISYETALSATQLNATSGGVAGTFVYTPAAGTVLTAGVHTLSVAFTPTDAVDYSAATATVMLTVTKATPTVVLASSANPSVYGVAVTFTATTSANATGTILFYDGGSVLGPGTISGGGATYTLNSLGGGTHSITASYAGDSNYLSAVSAAVSQVVTRAPVTITATSSLNPSNFGQSVTFTFTVTGVAGLTTPTGSIAFTDGGTLITSPTLNPLGVATYTTVTLSGGSHSLAAVYGGDANYQ